MGHEDGRRNQSAMQGSRLFAFAVLTAGIVAAVAGCGSVASRGQAASAVAQRLLEAVERKDGAAACALLAPQTAAEVSQSAQKDCAAAILDQNLPPAGTVTSDDVYGQWARVRLSSDTEFLGMFPGGWRVVAAGCTPRGDRPYDCIVQGN
jgi:hypothetical protein